MRPRVFESLLTGRAYVTRNYRELADGHFEAITKDEVTEDVVHHLMAMAWARGWNECNAATEGTAPMNPYRPETDMTKVVPATQIEQFVGVRRHPTEHWGRAVSDDRQFYILHSQECKDSGIDLRECVYSKALDWGIDGVPEWEGLEDRPVLLTIDDGILMPGVVKR